MSAFTIATMNLKLTKVTYLNRNFWNYLMMEMRLEFMFTLRVIQRKPRKLFGKFIDLTLVSDKSQHLIEIPPIITGILNSTTIVPCLATSKQSKVFLEDLDGKVSKWNYCKILDSLEYCWFLFYLLASP